MVLRLRLPSLQTTTFRLLAATFLSRLAIGSSFERQRYRQAQGMGILILAPLRGTPHCQHPISMRPVSWFAVQVMAPVQTTRRSSSVQRHRLFRHIRCVMRERLPRIKTTFRSCRSSIKVWLYRLEWRIRPVAWLPLKGNRPLLTCGTCVVSARSVSFCSPISIGSVCH